MGRKAFCKDPGFNEAGLKASMEAQECDGPGASAGWVPPNNGYYLSNYGMAFADVCTSVDSCNANVGQAKDGSQAQPFFDYPGSYYTYLASDTSTLVWDQHVLASVVRPSETGIIGDGLTIVRDGATRRVNTAFGCEGAHAHSDGCNMAFLNSHAKWVKGNPERYEIQGTDGNWYEKYFTVSQ